MPLDPAIAAFAAELAALDTPPMSAGSAVQARADYRALVKQRQGANFTPEPVATVEDLHFAGPGGALGARIYEPEDRRAATVVFFHGGGWVIGDLDTHDAYCRTLANATRARVASIDYRLAPEAPFPAPFEDCLAGVRWAAERWPQDRCAVAGDSAGGALAAGCALAVRDHGPALAAQLLIYPATDPSLAQPSVARNGEGYFLTVDDMRWFNARYLPRAALRHDPAVDLISREDLAGAAPTVLAVAEFDPLHDEGVLYAEHLREAGVPVTLIEGPGLVHGYFGMAGLSAAAARTAAEVRAAFSALL